MIGRLERHGVKRVDILALLLSRTEMDFQFPFYPLKYTHKITRKSLKYTRNNSREPMEKVQKWGSEERPVVIIGTTIIM